MVRLSFRVSFHFVVSIVVFAYLRQPASSPSGILCACGVARAGGGARGEREEARTGGASQGGLVREETCGGLGF